MAATVGRTGRRERVPARAFAAVLLRGTAAVRPEEHRRAAAVVATGSDGGGAVDVGRTGSGRAGAGIGSDGRLRLPRSRLGTVRNLLRADRRFRRPALRRRR